MARPLAMIAALGENRAIGIDNRLPWRLPADLKHFKAMTLGKPSDHGAQDLGLAGSAAAGPAQPGGQPPGRPGTGGAEVFASLDAALARRRGVGAGGGRRRTDADRRRPALCRGLAARRASLPDRVGLAPEGDAFFPRSMVRPGAWRRASNTSRLTMRLPTPSRYGSAADGSRRGQRVISSASIFFPATSSTPIPIGKLKRRGPALPGLR